MMRAAIVAVAMAFVFTSAGCPHHLSGPAERMKRPRPKRRPKDKPDPSKGLADLKLVEDCSANFNYDRKHHRKKRQSDRLVSQGVTLLKRARKERGEEQVDTYVDALMKLRSALIQDNYNANATYRLAAAYARLARKGCAIMLLKRLTQLQSHPDPRVVRTADLAINNVVTDSAFKRFRNDANSAVGR